jgi:hypothetical protein
LAPWLLGSFNMNIQCPNLTLRPGAQGLKRVGVDDENARLIVVFEAPISLPQQSYLLRPQSYALTGGQRLFPRILQADLQNPGSPPGDDGPAILLTLDGPGDFSIYTLTVSGPDIDPFFTSAKLRFRLACDSRFDCRPPAATPSPTSEVSVVVDYLAKDYSSFRQALLDFIPTRLPAWTERSEADIGMMLLELFAATADNLSYLQDRVANEAFLTTATQRRSVAGHLALLGYQMDQGASAHTWLQFQVQGGEVHTLPANFKVSNEATSGSDSVIVFETLSDATLNSEQNSMLLFDWGNVGCFLPSTALSATLAGRFDSLNAGDFLLFDDHNGHRDIVRLSAVPQIVSVTQGLSQPIGSPPPGSPPSSFLTIVTWSAATPLQNCYPVASTTTVSGNMVFATHGKTVPKETLVAASAKGDVRQRYRLSQGPLAYLDAKTVNLGAPPPSVSPEPPSTRAARSVSTLQVVVNGIVWKEQLSLLTSSPDSQVFRVEIDDDGEATVVFGDGAFGQALPQDATVKATYRLGGGQIGNLGADTLKVIYPDSPMPWLSVTNPLPALGGRNPESRDHARRFGPPLSQQPLMAVSSTDYQAAAASFIDANGRQPIQRAQASFRWTGSWLTVTLAVDPAGAEGLTTHLRQQLLQHLADKRLAGYDLEITGPIYLPIDLGLQFSTTPGFQPSVVLQGVTSALSNGVLPGGAKGFFHPDNFTFGQSLHVSKIYAAVIAVPGVQSAQITRLARLHTAQPDNETSVNLAQGFLAVGPDQIARLDNDRNFPENGSLSVQAKRGGT